MITFSIRMSKELYQWLKERAAKDGRSLNKEVIYLLRRIKGKEANGMDEPM